MSNYIDLKYWNGKEWTLFHRYRSTSPKMIKQAEENARHLWIYFNKEHVEMWVHQWHITTHRVFHRGAEMEKPNAS